MISFPEIIKVNRRMKLADRRRQIMEVGLELFARQGYYNTSVADIIRELGVARGTFYRYFVDKQDLYNIILSENINYLMGILPQFPVDHPLSPEEIERRIVKFFRDFMAPPTSRHFVQLYTETLGSEKALMEISEGFQDFFIKGFSKYFANAQESGFFRGRDPEILSFLLLALLKETFLHWAIHKDFSDPEKLVHELISLIVHGLRGRPGES